jgi:3-hydroxymyristoyl/3-hydroxydecanoyl-(acyl carrier protein) dehydratase
LENNQNYCIEATHPCFAGHFPDNPIVPGVVILNYVQQQLLSWLPAYQINTLSQAKFLHPLRPGEDFSIMLQQSSSLKNIKFSCTRGTDVLATGSIMLQNSPEAEHE